VEREDRAARRRDARILQQLVHSRISDGEILSRQVIECLVIAEVIRPAAPRFEVAKCRAACDPVRPWPEQVWRRQCPELPVNQHHHVLRDVLGVGRADDGADVTREHRLHARQQRLDRLAVANLRAQHPLRLLWGCHSPPSIAERRGGVKWFGISGAVRSV